MLPEVTFINPWFYGKAYIIFIVLLTIPCMIYYSTLSYNNIVQVPKSRLLSLGVGIIVLIFLGLRPLSGAFVDMMNYSESFGLISNLGYVPFEEEEGGNYIFNRIFYYLASNSYEIIFFFFIIELIYIGGIFWSLNKIFTIDIFYALVIYLGAFSTFSYGTNGIKAGAAASIFLLVFAYYKRPLLIALFCFLSLGFHHSMTVVIAAFILAYFIKNPKWYFYGWLFCLGMAILHISVFQQIFANFADEGGQTYLTANENDWGGRTGFRWDFILYSLPPIAIAWWSTYKYRIKDRLYQLLFCTYLTTNAIWMLCMYMPFNNRLAYLSWFLLPILICYPFFKFKLYSKQYKTLNLIAGVYLAFTVFTTFGGLI